MLVVQINGSKTWEICVPVRAPPTTARAGADRRNAGAQSTATGVQTKSTLSSGGSGAAARAAVDAADSSESLSTAQLAGTYLLELKARFDEHKYNTMQDMQRKRTQQPAASPNGACALLGFLLLLFCFCFCFVSSSSVSFDFLCLAS